uniref:zinc finger protein 721-like n=1 Tax=Pristiophorus japonicus TaxID=55135 RepID=UPI00398F1D35
MEDDQRPGSVPRPRGLLPSDAKTPDDRDGCFICSECGKSFERYGALERHLWLHRGPPARGQGPAPPPPPARQRPYPCPACPQRFGCPSRLAAHLRAHTGQGPYTCPDCRREFGQPASLLRHQRVHMADWPLQCDLCDREFKHRSALGIHRLFHMAEKRRRDNEQLTAAPTQNPQQPDSLLRPPGAPQDGTACKGPGGGPERADGQRRFGCPECGKGFDRHCHLKLHLLTHSGEKPLKCPVCGRGFIDPSNFRKHERTHTGERPFGCRACGKGFSQSSALAMHQLTHTGEQPFPCPACGRRFNKQCNLRRHERTHAGLGVAATDLQDPEPQSPPPTPLPENGSRQVLRPPVTAACPPDPACPPPEPPPGTAPAPRRAPDAPRRFACPQCGKGFNRNSRLKMHLLVHAGEKPLKCGACGRGFVDPSNLRQHERTHTGEKPFRCRACGREFSQSSTLLVHRLTHTGERPYPCAACGRRFNKQSNLRRHERTHLGERPCKCPSCGKGFIDPPSLRQHQRKHAAPAPPWPRATVVVVRQSVPPPPKTETHRTVAPRESVKSGEFPASGPEPDIASRLDRAVITGPQPAARPQARPQRPEGGGAGPDFPDDPTCGAEELRFSPVNPPGVFSTDESTDFEEPASPCSRSHSTPRPFTGPQVIPASTLESYGATRQSEDGDMELAREADRAPAPSPPLAEEATRAARWPEHLPDLGDDCFICSECGKSFERYGQLELHLARHGGGGQRPPAGGAGPHRCPVCGRPFAEPSALRRHRRSHGAERPFPCQTCGKGFGLASALLTHQRSHSGEKPYPCPSCPKRFSCSSHLAQHQRTHSGEKPFQCAACGRGFSRSGTLRRHEVTHTGAKPYKCPDCPKEFSHSSSLVKHQRRHKEDWPLQCGVCGREFKQRSALGIHKLYHLAETRRRRENEERLMNRAQDSQDPDSALQSTQVSQGGVASECPPWSDYPEAPKRFSCPDCGKGFNQNSRLKLHLRVHTGERPLTCADCGKGFSNSSNLRKHERTHTGEKPFQCPVCGKEFSQSSTLVAHQRTHTGEKPFRCSACGMDFNKQCNLRKHERTHTGEKPFACPVCGKGFIDPSSLRNHKGTHMGEKPFQCVACGKGFSNPSSLRKHKRIHAGDGGGSGDREMPVTPMEEVQRQDSVLPSAEVFPDGMTLADPKGPEFGRGSPDGPRRFSCSECGKGFNQNYRLKLHLLVHSGERPLKCPDCGRGFIDPSNLRKHRRTHAAGRRTPEDQEMPVTPMEEVQRPDSVLPSAEVFPDGMTLADPKGSEFGRGSLDGPRRFSCSECGKGFNQNYRLKLHLLVHSGERPLKCPDCGRGFIDPSNLRKHRRTHAAGRRTPEDQVTDTVVR